jgi:hypothetical protein
MNHLAGREGMGDLLVEEMFIKTEAKGEHLDHLSHENNHVPVVLVAGLLEI